MNSTNANGLCVFTDVSLNPELRFGLGTYLAIPHSYLVGPPQRLKESELSKRMLFRQFEGTSSTRLEVQTVLWALEKCLTTFRELGAGSLRIYSDSQCVAGLLGRRRRLEANGFLSAKTNRILSNAQLYRRFYDLFDKLHFELIQVKGHQRSASRDTVSRVFSLVDRAARRALKLRMQELSSP